MESYHTLIYAIGAGRGHAVRGVLISERLRLEGKSSLVLIRPGSLNEVEGLPLGVQIHALEDLNDLKKFSAQQLIVDTFPSGWSNELNCEFHNRFQHTIFVARYNTQLQWEHVSSIYDEIWLPYDKISNEWDDAPQSAKHIGILTKAKFTDFIFNEGAFVLFDPESRCTNSFLEMIERTSEEYGFSFSLLHKLPGQLAVDKLFIIGAGYNTFYEILFSKVDARFLPIKKRYDDQYRRATRYHLHVSSPDSVRSWLSQSPTQTHETSIIEGIHL